MLTFFKKLFSLFSKKKTEPSKPQKAPEPIKPTIEITPTKGDSMPIEPKPDIVITPTNSIFNWQEIDWNNKGALIAPNFTVHESLWLPSWRIYHIPSDAEKQEIVKTAYIMQKIRGLFNKTIIVHVWIRPISVNNPDSSYNGQNYNAAIGSTSTKSAHIFGKAVDYHVATMSGPEGCAQARQIILPHLEEWNIRMEDITGAWIHNDTSDVISKRFFKP